MPYTLTISTSSLLYSQCNEEQTFITIGKYDWYRFTELTETKNRYQLPAKVSASLERYYERLFAHASQQGLPSLKAFALVIVQQPPYAN